MADETTFLATVTISWASGHRGPQFLHMAKDWQSKVGKALKAILGMATDCTKIGLK